MPVWQLPSPDAPDLPNRAKHWAIAALVFSLTGPVGLIVSLQALVLARSAVRLGRSGRLAETKVAEGELALILAWGAAAVSLVATVYLVFALIRS